MAKRTQQFQTIRTEGAILPPDILRRIASLKVDGAGPGAYHLPPGSKLNEAISQSWTLLLNHWRAFQEARNQLPEDDTGTAVTNEKWLLPLFKELDYGRLVSTKSPEIDERTYPIERFYNHTPIHLIGCNLSLDRRTKGARGAATASPHSMVQEYLNRSDVHLWAFLSNGLLLRILRDNVSLSRQAYVEFDLEAMMEGEVYADFALLWLLCHQSRVESDKPDECWLEKWSGLAREQGTRVLNDLRIGVQNAIEALGRGFIGHPRNDRLREKLRSGSLKTDDYYRQLLRTVYRLLFLFVAEDRELLHPPDADRAACRLYDEHYSTRRLRDLALKIRGSKHADLWHSLSLIFDALGRNDGRPELGLCGLGSFLWRASSTADLLGPGQLANGSEGDTTAEPVLITNDDLLQAIRALAYVEQDRTLRTVDYRNMGSEELGSVYESLLELHPVMNAEAKAFDLKTAAGNERKTTGSYYTPDSLVQCLLDSALDPVVDERLGKKKGEEAEAAILDLKVCDPACGSGHFLIAAAHRLARHLARVRTGESEPNPEDHQRALRDVIGRCVYGVDINPMAVELCKVSLWMEAIEPGKPLSFLDHHIQCGNSLLGVTPALLAKGIPDDAFTAIEGDDKAVCKELKRRNKEEYKGQGFLFDAAGRPWERLGNLATAMLELDSVNDDTLAGVQDKQRRWQELVQSSGYLSGRLLADAWCAAFVWKKTREMGDAITESVFRRIERNPHDLTPWMRDEIKRLAEQHQFFHWHLSFPDVFRLPAQEAAENQQTGWNAGFDVVIGNPPWEKVKLQEREFFASLDSAIGSEQRGSTRKKLIAEHKREQSPLWQMYETAKELFSRQQAFISRTGHLPLTAHGDLNTYSLFGELCLYLISLDGQLGLVLKTGFLNAKDNVSICTKVLEEHRLIAAYDFKNWKGWFPAVGYHERFCLVTISGGEQPNPPSLAFGLLDPSEIRDSNRTFSLTVDEVRQVSPNTPVLPVFESARDANLAIHIYQNSGALVRGDRNPWGVAAGTMFHMTSDSSLFLTEPEKSLADTEVFPLWEGKLLQMYDPTFGDYTPVPENERYGIKAAPAPLTAAQRANPRFLASPRYWVRSSEVEKRWPNGGNNWVVAFRIITNKISNTRTCMGTVVPKQGFGNSIGLLTFTPTERLSSAQLSLQFLGLFSSTPFDYCARLKLFGSNLNKYILWDLPALPPDRFDATTVNFIVPRVIESTYTVWGLESFALECGYAGPPFRWNAERRFWLRCELDAAYFQLYLGSPTHWATDSPELREMFATPRDAVAYIMDSFPIVKSKDEAKHGSYRTKETILSIYDEMAEIIAANEAAAAAGREPTAAYRTRLDPPPGPPADAAGNFLPLPEWKPGQPRPANWPRHIHAPREVHEWAVANGIDWRTLLEPLGEAEPTVLG